MCSLQLKNAKCYSVDSSFNDRATCHKKHLVIYYMAVVGVVSNHMGRWAGGRREAACGGHRSRGNGNIANSI